MKRIVIGSIMLAMAMGANARLAKHWSEQELHATADLIVIARPIQIHDTDEKAVVLKTIRVVGLSTECKVVEVLKGDKSLKTFVLHHYRPAHIEDLAVMDGPSLLIFDPKQTTTYKMYLRREADGRYAPVSGQTDPEGTSIWDTSHPRVFHQPKD